MTQATNCDKCEKYLNKEYKQCPKCNNLLVSRKDLEAKAIKDLEYVFETQTEVAYSADNSQWFPLDQYKSITYLTKFQNKTDIYHYNFNEMLLAKKYVILL